MNDSNRRNEISNMNDINQEKEIREAILAGERALTSLQAAGAKLKSARNWGIYDLLGGGLLADLVKHSKLEAATDCMEKARQDLQIFGRELSDVTESGGLNLEIGGFLTFADFFFDGIITDYLVQSKIKEARGQVEHAVARVESILEELRRTV